MIADLKPYAEYKESGLSWLERLPDHWEVRRSKYLFREVDQRSVAGTETRLSMSQRHGLIPSSQIEERRLVSESNVGGKLCESGDLVLNRLKAHLGVLALSPMHGLVSPDYTVLRPIGTANHRYFCAVYRSPYCGQELRQRAKGIVEGFWRLYTDDFYDIRVPLPPPDEQAVIVRFLDWANGRLERAIRAKRKVIALLTEQKQVIIHRDVTRGLDPSVPLKPSGIPWLGDIPKHWEVRRCGSLFFEVVDTGHPTALLLSIDRVKGVIPQADTGRRTRASENRSAYKRVRPGQLAYNLMNAFMGSLGFSNYNGIVSPAYAVAQARWEIEPRFFHELFRTTAYTGEFNRLSYGIMYERNRLYFERFKLVSAVIPPLAEQREIVQGIQEQTAELNTTITRLEREIELLREYRTRLVADVVTGKLDVREAAARLPDEASPDTTEDDTDLNNEIEPGDDEAAL